MEKSTHKVEVVRIGALEKHPNADSLSIVKLFGGGYQCVVKTSEWAEGDLAAYVPPDSLVPLDRPEFAWLADLGRTPFTREEKGLQRSYHLIRVIKLRKVMSMGMLVKLPEGKAAEKAIGRSHLGLADDLATFFEVLHYEPPVKDRNTSKATTYGSAAEPAPSVNPPGYDIDSLRRYSEVFQAGEPVYITEKIHGANARYTAEDRGLFSYSFGRYHSSIRFGSRVLSWGRTGLKLRKLDDFARYMRVGSRNQWKRPDPNDIWWRALTPEMAKFCKNHPGKVLYGEVYGDVQDLDYGVPVGEVRFVAFDVLDENREWLPVGAFAGLMQRYSIPIVPAIAINMPFDLDTVLSYAEGVSPLAGWNGVMNQVREGVVVKPMQERKHPMVGRVVLKAVGTGYYERKAA